MGILGILRTRRINGACRYVLSRSKDGKKKDGRWFIDTDHEPVRVYISCPFCGKLHDISLHAIREDGIASPCVVCYKRREDGRRGCGRYLHVVLKGWDLGSRRERHW